MGHRANFVVIREGVAKAYEDQWAALGLTYQFAGGPDAASVLAEQSTPTTELMDWAFAEAGYLIDYDRCTTIVFGYPAPLDDDFGFDEAELEEFGIDAEAVEGSLEEVKILDAALEQGPLYFLKAIANEWQGWELRWDERGVDAFDEYLKELDISEIQTAPLSAHEIESPIVFQA